MRQIILIGDIHGCLYEFRDLMERVGYVEGDRIICLGDFMDKGPMQAECVQFARFHGFDSVRGNHDVRHVRWYDREKQRKDTGRPNNMRPLDPLDAAANERLTEEDIEWLRARPSILPFTDGEPGSPWLAVHGGLLPKKIKPWQEQNSDDVMHVRWIDREGKNVKIDYSQIETLSVCPSGAKHWSDLWDGEENVVFGHEAFSLSKPLHVPGRLSDDGPRGECWGIDTGAVHDGHLTALVLPQRRIYQVRARANYNRPPVYIPWMLETGEAKQAINKAVMIPIHNISLVHTDDSITQERVAAVDGPPAAVTKDGRLFVAEHGAHGLDQPVVTYFETAAVAVLGKP